VYKYDGELHSTEHFGSTLGILLFVRIFSRPRCVRMSRKNHFGACQVESRGSGGFWTPIGWWCLDLASSEKVRVPKKAVGNHSASRRTTLSTYLPIAIMDVDAAETKVQIRLSTRDPNLQIAEEPTILLVQTGKCVAMKRLGYLPIGGAQFVLSLGGPIQGHSLMRAFWLQQCDHDAANWWQNDRLETDHGQL